MVIVEHRIRKGKVLTPSAIPCLNSLPTVNVTLGCAHGCGYCYIQGCANYPGDDRIVLFVNAPDLIRHELSRMRVTPRRVFFSPSSDPFQYQPEVCHVTLESMRVLLEAGVQVAFLTKGFLTNPCFELFARFPASVSAQIGITTPDPSLSRLIEPRAAPPAMRLESMTRLLELGITCSARLDPLIPDVTDTQANLSALFEARPPSPNRTSDRDRPITRNHRLRMHLQKPRFHRRRLLDCRRPPTRSCSPILILKPSNRSKSIIYFPIRLPPCIFSHPSPTRREEYVALSPDHRRRLRPVPFPLPRR